MARYTPPPTDRDRSMSVVHHADSSAFDLRHAGAHLAGAADADDPASRDYNLKHARGHAARALDHVRALNDRLQANPRFDTHYKGLEGSPAEEAAETPAEERTEQRQLRRGTGPRRADRMARRMDRRGGR